MEGFVFDLQRFAVPNSVYESLLENCAADSYFIDDISYFEEEAAYGPTDYNGGIEYNNQMSGNNFIRVLVGDDTVTRTITAGTGYSSSVTMILNLSGYSEASTNSIIKIGYGFECYQGYKIVGVTGLKVIDKNNSSVKCASSGARVNVSGGANTYGNLSISSGSFSELIGTVICTGAVNVSGTGTAQRSGNGVITVTGGNITITGDNGTVNVKSGASVTIGSQTYTSRDNNSSLSVSGSTVTLTAGVFAATTTVFTLNSGVKVQQGEGTSAVLYTAEETGSKCKLVDSVMTLTAGKFTSSGASTVQVGSTQYVTEGAATIAVINNGAVLSSGKVTLDASESITVSDSTGNKTSAIAAGAGSSIDVTVTDGAYVISGLAGGEIVSIDNVTYTYNATDKTLSKDGVGWKLNNNSIRFTINAGTDTFDTEYGIAVEPDMKTELNAIMGRMTSAGTLYFNASGIQQASSDGAAYTLTKDAQDNYTLTSTTNSTDNLLIDLAGVADGKLAVLTINLAAGTTGAQQVKLKAGAGLGGLTLGAGDSVLDSSGTTLAKAGTASGTVTVENGGVKALTGGSFEGVGEHNIEATSAAVTIDGVTFAAGAEGTFTNGATAAADTFTVTTGTASIDSNFQGTTVTANGVTYTVVPGSTVATFYGTTNEVTGFTSGKITLTAADNTSYTIGGQTISDGNGAELTFISNTYSESNASTADTLDFYGQGVTSVNVTSKGLKLYNGEDSMLISGSFDENTMFQWKNDTSDKIRVVKAGRANTTNNMSYDYAVTDYVGSSKVDTITVADSGVVEIWMDGSKDKSYNSIEVINAAGNAYDVTIAGGEGNNTLIGSQGNSSLWGGAGNGIDVLIGNGHTNFFYGLGNGNDSISGHQGDTVELFDMKLSDITEAVIDTANKRVILKTIANETVTVSGGVTDFKVGNQLYITNYKSGGWITK